eukprot:SAG11_NODE_5965_length_1423_cov_2.926737_1_plen_206_part_10
MTVSNHGRCRQWALNALPCHANAIRACGWAQGRKLELLGRARDARRELERRSAAAAADRGVGGGDSGEIGGGINRNRDERTGLILPPTAAVRAWNEARLRRVDRLAGRSRGDERCRATESEAAAGYESDDDEGFESAASEETALSSPPRPKPPRGGRAADLLSEQLQMQGFLLTDRLRIEREGLDQLRRAAEAAAAAADGAARAAA